ncbi:MAG: YraN family protein [Pseudomonadales bacterium]|nr:YraN family protein [Pseudomonadales bacterium]NIX06914.1 YraN family protein [Pseudomonadales bacterium]
MTARARAGAQAESAALDHLRSSGLTLVSRNFRCRLGELDLVMEDGKDLVFVEVRLRNHARFGDGAASITAAKRQKLVRAARAFLQRNPRYQHHPCRFDVVAVNGQGRTTQLRWIRHAFAAGD